jgi:hypothetical protein
VFTSFAVEDRAGTEYLAREEIRHTVYGPVGSVDGAARHWDPDERNSVGGKGKDFGQVRGVGDSYLAVDGIERGSGARVPLWRSRQRHRKRVGDDGSKCWKQFHRWKQLKLRWLSGVEAAACPGEIGSSESAQGPPK